MFFPKVCQHCKNYNSVDEECKLYGEKIKSEYTCRDYSPSDEVKKFLKNPDAYKLSEKVVMVCNCGCKKFRVEVTEKCCVVADALKLFCLNCKKEQYFKLERMVKK